MQVAVSAVSQRLRVNVFEFTAAFGVHVSDDSVGVADYFVVIVPHIFRIAAGGDGVVSSVEYRVEVIARTVHVGSLVFGIHKLGRTFAVERYAVELIGGVSGFHQLFQSADGIGSVFFIFE